MRPIFLTLWRVTFGLAAALNYAPFHTRLESAFIVLPAAWVALALVGVRVRSRRYHGFLALFYLATALFLMATDRTVLQ